MSETQKLQEVMRLALKYARMRKSWLADEFVSFAMLDFAKEPPSDDIRLNRVRIKALFVDFLRYEQGRVGSTKNKAITTKKWLNEDKLGDFVPSINDFIDQFKFKPRDRITFVLTYYFRMSPAEIALCFGTEKHFVNNWMFEIRKRIEEVLNKDQLRKPK